MLSHASRTSRFASVCLCSAVTTWMILPASGTALVQAPGRTPDHYELVIVTWHVDDDALPGGNGSRAAPFQTIDDAVSIASNGDTVVVHDGLYTGSANRNIDFSGRILTVRSQHGPARCIIDCENSGRAFEFANHYGNEAARISGFTIRNGNVLSGSGGIHITRSSPTIENCVFENCRGRLGGALLAFSSNSTIRSCVFTGNSVIGKFVAGGGAYVSAGFTADAPHTSPKVIDCTFTGNTAGAGGSGGGIVLAQSSYWEVTMSHCRFFGNSAGTLGGGVMVETNGTSVTGKVVRIENCVVAGNTADSGGGIRTAGHVLVRDCTVVDNHALETGGGIEHGSYVERPIENCVLWGNSAPDGAQLSIRWSSAPVPVRYCDVQGGQAAVDLGSSVLIWGPGNLTAIPQFVDADGLDNNPATYVDNDYRLSSASPCIDAGDTSVLPADVLDLDGDFVTSEPVPFDLDFNPRRIDIVGVPDTGVGRAPVVDIGAYERQ